MEETNMPLSIKILEEASLSYHLTLGGRPAQDFVRTMYEIN